MQSIDNQHQIEISMVGHSTGHHIGEELEQIVVVHIRHSRIVALLLLHLLNGLGLLKFHGHRSYSRHSARAVSPSPCCQPSSSCAGAARHGRAQR
ncbi:hypothetical protein PFISCL1PPCAC_26270, partial [Pristionchus fissidentatus]